jgi:hypothetical protein
MNWRNGGTWLTIRPGKEWKEAIFILKFKELVINIVKMEIVTKEDLQAFRIQLIDDIKRLLSSNPIDAASPEWVKSAEARRILKASPGTLQNLRVSGKLHPVKIAGTWYYNSQEIASLFVKKCGKQ